MRDRLYINANLRKSVLKDWDDNNILGFHLADKKDIFLLAVALGINEPMDINGKKDGYFRLDNQNIKTYDKALFASLLLGKINDEKEVDRYANMDLNYDEAEKCAESGFNKLAEMIAEADNDGELLEKRIIGNLNLLYHQYVVE